MSQTLYRKYRPQKFSEIIAQKHITKTITNAIKNDRIAHAYLFTGPRGTGKTTIARILASAINCEKNKNGEPCLKCKNCQEIINSQSIDIFEIDAASHTGVDNIRELKETINIPPTHGKYKVYIIDEVHMLSQGAFNALLKTLEEPPKHVVFILATTEIHKIPETILSRCQRFDFSMMSMENIIEKLSLIAKNEKVKISKESLELIAIAAEGGMRDAESLLGQIMSLEDKNITKKEVEEILGVSEHTSIEKISESLSNKDISSIFIQINQLSKEGYDLEVFTKSLLNYLRKVLIIKFSDNSSIFEKMELTKEQISKCKEISEKTNSQELIATIDNLLEAQNKIRSAFIPQLPLEIAFVKSIQNPSLQSAPKNTTLETPKDSAPIKKEQQPATPAPKQITQKKTSIEEVKEIKTEKPTHTSSPSSEQENQSEESQVKEMSNRKKALENAKEITLDDVASAWQRIREEIGKGNKSLSSFLSTCRPSDVIEKNVVVIAAKYDFHKEKLCEANNRLTIEENLDKILGTVTKINVIVEKPTNSSQEDYYAALDKDKDENQESGDLINNALNIFGGKVVEE